MGPLYISRVEAGWVEVFEVDIQRIIEETYCPAAAVSLPE